MRHLAATCPSDKCGQICRRVGAGLRGGEEENGIATPIERLREEVGRNRRHAAGHVVVETKLQAVGAQNQRQVANGRGLWCVLKNQPVKVPSAAFRGAERRSSPRERFGPDARDRRGVYLYYYTPTVLYQYI